VIVVTASSRDSFDYLINYYNTLNYLIATSLHTNQNIHCLSNRFKH